jgi:hypothetical protein
MLTDFDALFAVTRDERFVTAPHCMQSLVGAAGKVQQAFLVSALEVRFNECGAKKDCTLIRYDIEQSLRWLCDAVEDEEVRAVALRLVESEEGPKCRKKYAGVWKQRAAG